MFRNSSYIAKLCLYVLIGVSVFACDIDWGTPIYRNAGDHEIRLVMDTVTCGRDQQFFYWVDSAILSDESMLLPQVLFVDEGLHIISVNCPHVDLLNTWRDTLDVAGDTTLVVTCESCR